MRWPWQRKVEQRDASVRDVLSAVYGYTPGGQSPSRIGPIAAQNLSCVLAAVNCIASGVASLPAFVYRQDGDQRTEQPNHPVSRLIRTPNPYQVWGDWIEQTLGDVLLNGNSLSGIEWDNAGRPISLTPIPWRNVSVSMLPSGRLAYDAMIPTMPGAPSMRRRYLQDEVVHIKDRSDDGLIGVSRISRAHDVLANAASLQEWSLASWRNAGTPSGAIELDGVMRPEQYDRLQARLDASVRGVSNARGVLVLDNSAHWKPLSVSPVDAEVLASRKFSVEEIARVFQVPPPLLQALEFNSYSNAATASRWFAMFSLSPWIRRIESVMGNALLSPGYSLEIDMGALMRGDSEQRWIANVAAVDAGILSINDVRRVESWPPLSGAQYELPMRKAAVATNQQPGGSGGLP